MLQNYKNIYFLGIGGIGMSALARWFLANGYNVAGYDRTPTELTTQLTEEGADIHYTDDISLVPDVFKENIFETLVVLTPAMPQEHKEWAFFKENHYVIQKRAQVLGIISQNHFTIAVAGTHGKTTTSSFIAHILRQANKNVTAFLGGITKNYNTNLLLSNAPPKETLFVVEADEYDKSFLQLNPDIAVITSIDADHLDIYENAENVANTYESFAKKTKPKGQLFLHKSIPFDLIVATLYYHQTKKTDYYAENIKVENGHFVFDYISPKQKIENIVLSVVGFHNIENAIVALAVCESLGLDALQLKTGVSTFLGAKRRFDFWQREEGKPILIDDYAHHPTEITAFLTSVRALYPQKWITAVFQPHLYTRTRDFMNDFAKSLSLADEVILLPIYPARELPIEGVTSDILLEKITSKNKKVLPKNEIPAYLKKLASREVICVMGAGDVDSILKQL
jgi:UDP-N-acetylmuramate--alanine ligase